MKKPTTKTLAEVAVWVVLVVFFTYLVFFR
jgi:hypothetical protein